MRLRLFALMVVLVASACSSGSPSVNHGNSPDADGMEQPDAGEAPESSTCTPCVASNDCKQDEICVQLLTDSDCLEPCMTSADCVAGQSCVPLTTVNGNLITACLADNGSCGTNPNEGRDAGFPTARDAGSPPSSDMCGTLAGPSVSGTNCRCGRQGQCAANNCYGGWWCDTASGRCVNPPASCDSTDAGPGPQPVDAGSGPGPVDAGPGPVPTGSVDAHNGGRVSSLFFAVVGDTRPANIDDTANYPTQIANGIYGALARMNPAPQFVVTTGDYMFASTSSGQASRQMALYLQAASLLHAPLWPAMGNHECTGATASNCGLSGSNTQNYQAFLQSMMQPIGESQPYYVRRVDATDGSWTAKFVVVAPNAWNSTQASWFSQQLAQSTTYTFVVHHEPSNATQAPGISQINQIVSQHPVTLSIVGHTHTWERYNGEVIIGNGGAPLTTTIPYGYTLFQQRSDGSIQVTAYDYSTGRSFQQFAVTATGASAP